ncbi:MAG TPA: flagellar basal-body MS-ring/collar protein FliF [bacterium]|nr:flagellar basal-body MS-ring/collar protein FliF [bacterium]
MAQGNPSSRLKIVWMNLTVGQRIMLVGTVFAIVAAIVVGSLVAQRAGYSTLYSGLSAEEAGQVAQKLDQKSMPYRVVAGGTAIAVPSSKVYSTRIELASEGFPRSGTVGFEIFDKSVFGMTDFLQKVNYRRALEGELAKTIAQLDEVEGVRVHIVVPERALFKEDEQPATASVVLKINPARTLGAKQVQGIAYLVSSSVEGLTPDHVTIIDTRGTLLSKGFPDQEGGASDGLELRKSVEDYLEGKAQTLLDGVLGGGKSVVRVSATLNLKRIQENVESYDPESAVIRSEERTDNSESGGGRNESSVTNYEMNKTVQNIAGEVGNVERLSIAVMVDGTYETTGTGDKAAKKFVPRTDAELKKIAGIVKSAVGFDAKRNDYFEIASIAFDRTYMDEEGQSIGKMMRMQFYMSLARKGGYIAAAVVMLIFVVRMVKKSTAILGEISKRPLDLRVGGGAEGGQGGLSFGGMPGEVAPREVVNNIMGFTAKNPGDAAAAIKTMMTQGD